jgi:RNA polymerase sigma factor (sigma-70 family)
MALQMASASGGIVMFEASVSETTTVPDSALPETETPDPWAQLDDLVAGARRGERCAWDALVERYRPLVRAVASGYRLNGRDVEDIDQTVWLRLVENLDRIREPRALPKWLITTAGNECRRLMRTRQRTLLIGVLDEPVQENGAEPPGAPETDLLRRELAQTVQQGLAELPVAQQQVLRLLAGERRLSYREISRILVIPVGSIGPTRARGLARLRATVAVREYVTC